MAETRPQKPRTLQQCIMQNVSIRWKKFIGPASNAYGKKTRVPYQIVGMDEEGLNVLCVRVKYLVPNAREFFGRSNFPDGSYVRALSTLSRHREYEEPTPSQPSCAKVGENSSHIKLLDTEGVLENYAGPFLDDA